MDQCRDLLHTTRKRRKGEGLAWNVKTKASKNERGGRGEGMRGKEKYDHSSCTHFSLVPPWLHSLDSVFFKWYLKRFFLLHSWGLASILGAPWLAGFFFGFYFKRSVRGRSLVSLPLHCFLILLLQASFNNEMVTSVVFNICNYSQSYCRRTKMSV